MNDMSGTILAKVDQIVADELIGRDLTITITGVEIKSTPEQPVTIHYQGENGKPYRPCKSMCRVLVNAWGADANQYAGRSLTLYRDPGVKFGGLEVGGIRISHMSHIDRDLVMALTMTKANKKPYRVRPLVVEQPKAEAPKTDKIADGAAKLLARATAIQTKADYDALEADASARKQRDYLRANRPDLSAPIEQAIGDAFGRLNAPSDDMADIFDEGEAA